MKQNNLGFTLVELVIVVLVLGVLGGISVSIINPTQQNEKVNDGVRLRTVKTIAESIESYNQIEGNYPPNTSIGDPNSMLYEVYLDKWPGEEYRYQDTGDDFILEVENSSGDCYKYQSTWSQVLECPPLECALSDGETPTESSSNDCSSL